MTTRTLAASILLLTACHSHPYDRGPELVLLPDGYSGWTRIDYGVAGAPLLPHEGEWTVIRFPSGGHVMTSSRFVSTYGRTVVEYYKGDRTAPAAESQATRADLLATDGDPVTWYWHWGTPEESQSAWARADIELEHGQTPTLGAVRADRRTIH
jgi:hypothetical protein